MIKIVCGLAYSLLVLVTMQSQAAFADCAALGKQTKENDMLLVAAAYDYKRMSDDVLSRTTHKPEEVAKAISANNKVIEAISNSIGSLERGEADGCFGKQAAAWKIIVDDLKIKRKEFDDERQVLLKAASLLVPKTDWKTFLTPSITGFAACLVQAKRRALALDSKRPSPQDFALIIRGACNTEASAIDTEQNKIEGWTQESRLDIKQSLDALRARNISEYSTAFYGMR
jgi:hypothetical protein